MYFLMPKVACKICAKKFYAKPFHQRKGWGIFCSPACSHTSKMRGKFYACATCNNPVWRTPKEFTNSKGKKFFCNKACHAKLKNKLWSLGEDHFNWKGGSSVYREVMLRAKIKSICRDCGIKDIRVLVVHHLDENRKNNQIHNLCWLCRNCHYLIHKGKTI